MKKKTWTVGSCFAGIGGFELGLEWAFDAHGIDHKVKWQIEQNTFCQRILKKHWPDSVIYDDIKTTKEIEPVHIMIGGFPCTDISIAGKQKGIEHGEKSSLWFEMLRIIGDIRPQIVVLENVPAITRVGGSKVVGGLAAIGYDCEWTIISARQFGAPHLRKRWFCIATDSESNNDQRNTESMGNKIKQAKKQKICAEFACETTNYRKIRECNKQTSQRTLFITDSKSVSNDRRINRRLFDAKGSGQSQHAKIGNSDQNETRSDTTNAWRDFPTQSPFCDGNDGVSDRVARLRALGNAIVPQCSEWVFEQIIQSGLLEDRGQGDE